MSDDSTKKVPMDHRTTLFYKGVAAGNEIERQHAETEFPDQDSKVKAFFFYGGAIAAGEHKITEAADFGYFMEGLVLRAPHPPQDVPVTTDAELLSIANEDDLITTVSKTDLISALSFTRSTIRDFGTEDVATFLGMTDESVAALKKRLDTVIKAVR